jgi:hypothetical protein
MKMFLDDKKLKENSFELPEGYFEALTERTLLNVGIESSKEISKPTIKRSLVPLWSSIAASLVVALMASWYIVSEFKSSVNDKYYLAIESSIQDYSINTLASFIDLEADDFDTSNADLWLNDIDENILFESESE